MDLGPGRAKPAPRALVDYFLQPAPEKIQTSGLSAWKHELTEQACSPPTK